MIRMDFQSAANSKQDSNGFLERPQDTTRAALEGSVPKDDTSWGVWSSEQSYIPGTDTKAEEEWGVINDTSCHVTQAVYISLYRTYPKYEL